MAKNKVISHASPLEVEAALKQWGSRLRTARLARNLSMDHVATKLGMNRRVVSAAEAGKPGTAVAVYCGLMWLYGLVAQLNELADPARDDLTLRALAQRAHSYPSTKGALDNDF